MKGLMKQLNVDAVALPTSPHTSTSSGAQRDRHHHANHPPMSTDRNPNARSVKDVLQDLGLSRNEVYERVITVKSRSSRGTSVSPQHHRRQEIRSDDEKDRDFGNGNGNRYGNQLIDSNAGTGVGTGAMAGVGVGVAQGVVVGTGVGTGVGVDALAGAASLPDNTPTLATTLTTPMPTPMAMVQTSQTSQMNQPTPGAERSICTPKTIHSLITLPIS